MIASRNDIERCGRCTEGDLHGPRQAAYSLALFTLICLNMATVGRSQVAGPSTTTDRLKELQTAYANAPSKKMARAYHFGSQHAGDVFSNHTSHSNRLIPVYVFGSKADLSAVTGQNSRYRDAERIKPLYGGVLPANTLNPRAVYGDQSDLYEVQRTAIARGVKHLFIVWFDGMDWQTTQAAAIAKTGKIYSEGKGTGLSFLDYDAAGTAQYGFVVTSPTHDKAKFNVNTQTVSIPAESMPGGYDVRFGGPNPWTPGALGVKAPGYLKGQSANATDKAGVIAAGGILHAYTDSSQSAAEIVSGVKSYNSGLNIADDGKLVTTLFQELQQQGWKVGTVTSVPFDHASPAGMYAQNVYRDDYQDLARVMLGLPGILQQARKAPLLPGLDVVMGTGYGVVTNNESLNAQGENGVGGKLFITDADLKAIDVTNGGKYVVVHTTEGVDAGQALKSAAAIAVKSSARLFGFFGRDGLDHLPYQTTDGRFDPAPSINRKGETAPAESYTPADRVEQPTLVQMTEAALTVLASDPLRPFALFIEAGDVDFALHANNLDNAIGAVYSGDAAVQTVIRWVEKRSNWTDSMMIVASDHGHYLVVDDLQAIAGSASR
jgi:alkaline phosphatase